MSQFIYLLNAMEAAAQASNPALEEYGIKRRKVLEYVEKLEAALREYVQRQPDLRRLHEDITGIVANSLHYIENAEEIRSLKRADEVQAAIEGGIRRFMEEPRFNASVQTLVARIMERVSRECEEDQ